MRQLASPIPELSDNDLRRFWCKINRREDSNCWEWTAGKQRDGYGNFRINKRMYLAHRVSLVLAGKTLRHDLQIDHLCRNRSCVNPAHLDQVDSKTNTLRGDSPAAKAARSERCSRGHEYTEENTKFAPFEKTPRRYCKLCWRINSRTYRQKRAGK